MVGESIGTCVCLKCKKDFQGEIAYSDAYVKGIRQEVVLCDDCYDKLMQEHIDYYGYHVGDTVYTAKLKNINHKEKRVLVKATITKIELYNYDNTFSLFNTTSKRDDKWLGSSRLDFKYVDFSPIEVSNLFTYYLITDDNRRYSRKLNEIYKDEDDCIAYIEKRNGYKCDSEMSELDMYLMGEQNLIYNTIQNFLKSDEAIQFGLTGIEARVENGYVNAEWKFGKRKKGDIK